MTRANGTPVVVEPEPFLESAHGSFACVDCHTDLATLTEFPHPEELKPVECAMCHDEPSMQLSTSVHARAPAASAGGRAGLQCADCHGPPHRIRPSSETDSATHAANLTGTCGECHVEATRAGPRQGPAVAAMFADSIHGRLLARGDTKIAPTCATCHRSHDVRATNETESPVHRLNVPMTCGTCHTGIEGDFRESIHGSQLAAGNSQAPNCASCHSAHQIRRTDTEQHQIAAVEQCGTCHREALATYRDTFHGQVTALGFAPVAKCVDCHRPHSVFPRADPRSAVSSANLLKTCQTCHPSANENFIKYQPHANAHEPERFPALYYAARFMNGLLIGTFGFFGLHTGLWFLRERAGGADAHDEEPRG